MNLLLVDDEPRILTGLSRALRTAVREWQVTTATSGEEALDHLAAQPYDIVVSDMRMPGMDGPALLTVVRERWPDCARLVLSGHADLRDSARVAAIAHQFLDKPLRINELVSVLQRVTRLRQRFATPELRAVLGRIGDLPCAPAVFAELGRVTADDTAPTDTIVRVVERDPALAAKVLKLASSSFFVRGTPIADLRGAVLRLGVRVVRMVALSQAFQPPAAVAGLIDEVHARAFDAAALAAGLVSDSSQVEFAFAAALLADIGITALATWFPAEELVDVATAAGTKRPLYEVETARWGVSHAEVGGYLLGLWGLPHPVVEGVTFHHAVRDVDPPSRSAALAAHLAHALVAGETIDEEYVKAAGAGADLASLRAFVGR